MIKYFMRYDHQNYARGPVYVMEMHQLPGEIVQLFKQAHFVVNHSPRKFNQVSQTNLKNGSMVPENKVVA